MPFKRASNKIDYFHQPNGDLRVMAADYPQTNAMLGFFW